ncbi:MAG TPA: serine/threonine-protein kinase [Pseudonocardiaceae bacterium]
MSGIAQVIGSMLSWLHQYPITFCPGAWPWTVTLAGGVFGLFPVLGAILVALVRKGTGNNYGVPTMVVFGLFGGVFGFLLPWLGSTFVSDVVHTAVREGSAPGLSGRDVADLRASTCVLDRFGTQGGYLGRGHTVFEALMRSSGGTFAFVVYVVTLVGLPVLCLLAVLVQQRVALRRGPHWPGRLMWLPFVAFAVATIPLEANLMAHLWLGFLVVSVPGVLVVALLGSPSWSVVNRPPREAPPVPAQPPASATYPPPRELYRQPPPSMPYRPLHNTPLAPMAPAPARLADTPGPLPFATRDSATVLWNSAGGRFRRERQLGHGGFGTVWLAKDTQLDRTVALKFAHAPDADTQARMMREARALAAVHHPNCVRVYDIIEDVDGLGIVMEFIDGQPLSDAVGHGRLDDVAAARLWATMAGALASAHVQGVLHRDVKPANVLVDREGMPHLIDFGIARARGDQTLTAAGLMMGTPDFLAPETASTGVATPASDAWQLAATVSYALTGQPPRGHRSNPMSALMAAAQRLPNTHLPDRSQHLALLAAALDADPGRRPTLSSVHRELTAWLGRAGHSEDGPVTKVSPVRLAPGR